MSVLAFTAAQQALISAPGSIFVDACPGAGKTQSIVQRFLERPNVVNRRGVALLSFTNAAVNEVKARCANQPHLLQVPNFVGTIDSFINRYIVGPLYRRQQGRWPSFKDRWHNLQGTTFNMGSAPKIIFRLEWFGFDDQGHAKLDSGSVPQDQQYAVAALKSYQIREACVEAANIYAQFSANGVMDAEGARRLMWRFLDDDYTGGKVGILLESRFAEVIVDEVQDCSANDIRLLEFLHGSGINLVMVGDMDQAIYGFRESTIDAVHEVARRVTIRHRLDDNFRSSPSICQLVNSLRFGGAIDKPAGRYQDTAEPIHILSVASFSKAKPPLINIVQECGASSSELIVLAHVGSHARSCAGGAAAPVTTSDRLLLLARSSSRARDRQSSARIREQAMQEFESILRGLADKRLLYLSDEEFYRTIGLTQRALREGCVRLIYRVDPFSIEPSQFKEEIKFGIDALGWDRWINLTPLRTPKGNVWRDKIVRSEDMLRWSTIHSFKGLQSPAVALVIPPESPKRACGVKHWKDQTPEEARRILYVGASRAEKLLILVIHKDQMSSVVECLERDKVQYVSH